jgi:hypothetical protein
VLSTIGTTAPKPGRVALQERDGSMTDKPWWNKLKKRRLSKRPFEDHSTISLQRKLKIGVLDEKTSALVRAELALRGEPELSN